MFRDLPQEIISRRKVQIEGFKEEKKKRKTESRLLSASQSSAYIYYFQRLTLESLFPNLEQTSISTEMPTTTSTLQTTYLCL